MTGSVLAEGQHQRVTSARMDRAFAQKRHARSASPGALPRTTVIGDLRPNGISGYLRSNGQQVKRWLFKNSRMVTLVSTQDCRGLETAAPPGIQS